MAGPQTKPIGDICEVVNGGTPKTKLDEYWGGEHFWITPAEMGKRKSPYVENTQRRITSLGLQHCSANMLPPNSVILSSRAPIGHLVINTVPMAFNQGCKGMVPSDKLNHKYLYYFLASNVGLLNSLGTGATFKELSSGKLKSVEIPLPPLPEQKRIVAILDEAFAGIDAAIANTEKNLAHARELFESYLNAVFTQKGDGWVEKPLEESIRFIDYRGKTPKKTESGLRLITAKNVRMGYLRREPEEFVSPDSYDSWMTRGTPEKGDVLFTTEAPLGLVCQLDTSEKVVFAQRIITMQPDRSLVNPSFLKYALMSSLLQSRIHEKATGATAQGIKASLLKKIPFPCAGIEEQKAIVESLDAMSLESQRLETIFQQKLSALAELKQSILQKAFAGELTAGAAAETAGHST